MRRLQNKEDAIIILCKGANELSYIQAYHDGGGKWTLEYQDGHLDEHYKAENHVDGEYVSRSFQYYCEGDERWKTQTRWKRIEI